MFNQAHCKNCQAALNPAQYAHSQYCTLAPCQRAKVAVQLASKKVTEQAIKQQVLVSSNGVPEPIPSHLADQVLLTPANTSPLSPLPEQRKKAFLTHLADTYHNINSEAPVDNNPYAFLKSEITEQAISDLQLEKACSTCRGHCCLLGGTHAFQDPISLKHNLPTITKHLKVELTQENLLNLYAEFFPKQTSKAGCVFQGEKGCSLPTDLRSVTCNRFFCKPIIEFSRLHQQKAPTQVWVGAVSDKTLQRQG